MGAMAVTRCGESRILEWLAEQRLTPASGARVKLGIGDDMAIIDAAGDVLITTDMLLDGVHFDLDTHGFYAVGRKAIACSLSDCAAMAVKPLAATVSFALPDGTELDDVQKVYHGMRSVADTFDCAIVGGDTTSWGQRLAIDIAMLAVPFSGIQPVLRRGALAGDALLVTGTLGGSLLGKHVDFAPRVHEAKRIAARWGTGLHAMMDLSDGLSLDLHRMCSASNVGAVLDESLIEMVISGEARTAAAEDQRSPLDHALSDGEDFELLISADEAVAKQSVSSVALHRVGTIVESGVLLRTADGRTTPLEPKGYEHLR